MKEEVGGGREGVGGGTRDGRRSEGRRREKGGKGWK